MDSQRHQRLLDKYFVPNMGLYTEPGGEITAIVSKLDSGDRPSEAECKFLRDKGLGGLATYAEHFARTGNRDRRLLRTADDRRRDAAFRNRALRERYGIGFIDQDEYPRMMSILRMVENGGRLSDEDVVWLNATSHFTYELKQVFHRNEAHHHRKLFDANRNPHDAVSANSHYRKAGQPDDGLRLLERVDFGQQRDARLKSALYTTKGGSLRDLRRHEEAMRCAESGHDHDPDSFHPCTLLGALHYEEGNRPLGDEWFAKAVQRGATPDAIDSELRAIWRRSNQTQRSDMRRHLLEMDPIRYAWVKQQHLDQKPPRAGRSLRPS